MADITAEPPMVKSLVLNIIEVRHLSEFNCTDPNKWFTWVIYKTKDISTAGSALISAIVHCTKMNHFYWKETQVYWMFLSNGFMKRNIFERTLFVHNIYFLQYSSAYRHICCYLILFKLLWMIWNMVSKYIYTWRMISIK